MIKWKDRLFQYVIAFFLLFALVWHFPFQQRKTRLYFGVISGNKWNVPNSSTQQVLDQAIKNFEKDHPNVQIVYESGIQQKDYGEWLSRQLLRGKSPDIFWVPEENFTRLANQGALKDISSYLKKDQINDYYPVAIQAGCYRDKVYALPLTINPVMMCVNKDLLKESNIDVPQTNWTVEDFSKICQQVNDLKRERYAVTDYNWEHAFIAYGGVLEGPNGMKVDTKEMHEALKLINFLHSLTPSQHIRPEDFDEGKVAFYPMTLAQYRTYRPYPYRVTKYSNLNWTCIPMPSKDSKHPATQIRTSLLAVSPTSRQVDLACEFALYLSQDPNVQKQLMIKSPEASVLRSVVKSRAIQDQLKKEGTGLDVLTTERLDEMLLHGELTVDDRYDRQKIERLDYLIQRALESKEISSVLPSIQKEMNEKW
ncbi:ABC transporter substrate-binding protein [Atopobacter sp. AH10]|uniref:ABC transporter substrate-binding protein n=1 Tax=Atopobacter sp. AH10 TaxID=2315861 RepID=UPI001314695D|nr:extracellular solute-binding protein [Atopobacter sp. AH10]